MPSVKLPFRNRQSHRRSAFTLVELLVVIAIIGVLLAVLLPAVNSAREAARRISCGNHLRQIGIAINSYVSAHDVYPAGSRPVPDHPEFEPIAWSVEILEHLEQKGIFDKLDLDGSDLRSAQNREGTSTVISTYLCPSADQNLGRRYRGRLTDFTKEADLTSRGGDGHWTEGVGEEMGCIDYMGIAGPSKAVTSANGSKFKKQQGVLIDFEKQENLRSSLERIGTRDLKDGLSNTMVVAESTTRSVWFDFKKDPPHKWELSGTWASGENISHIEFSVNTFGKTGVPDGTELREVMSDGEVKKEPITPEEEIYSDHPDGAYLLFADSSVHFARTGTPIEILAALATRQGIKYWGENPHPSADDVE